MNVFFHTIFKLIRYYYYYLKFYSLNRLLGGVCAIFHFGLFIILMNDVILR